MVEAFPAAQLCQWGLPHEAYNRSTEKEGSAPFTCKVVTDAVRACELRGMLKDSADALDAVVCAFAANAVAIGHAMTYAEDSFDTEGVIAVASA
jgi:Protein of unknown function (DUF429)